MIMSKKMVTKRRFEHSKSFKKWKKKIFRWTKTKKQGGGSTLNWLKGGRSWVLRQENDEIDKKMCSQKWWYSFSQKWMSTFLGDGLLRGDMLRGWRQRLAAYKYKDVKEHEVLFKMNGKSWHPMSSCHEFFIFWVSDFGET